jgi:predicted RNA-binding protein YlxR (DUF448 family)
MTDHHVPIRTCIGCRQRVPRTELIRFVLAERAGERHVVRDDAAGLPGRGAWLHDDAECWSKAERKRAIRRALRTGRSDVAFELRHTTSEAGVGHVTSPTRQEERGRSK